MLRVAFTATPYTPANNPPTILTGGSHFSDQMLGASSKLSIHTTGCPISLSHHWPSAFLRLAHHHSLTSSHPPLAAVPRHHLHPSRSNSHLPIKSSQQFNLQWTNGNLQENSQASAGAHLVPPSHPWPEWLELLESISASGHFGNRNMKDEFVPNESLSMEFVDAACCCLGFAHDRHDLLGWLFKDDIQVLVNNGTPFLFKNAIETEKRMRSFLQEAESNEATMVDLMKYILSYASNPIFYPERIIKEDIESSARNLLREMANLNGRVEAISTSSIEKVDAIGEDEQTPRILETNITMKRGDWICQKCSFMNFAKKAKCLECNELRPQRQLTGREWDCPQCDFFNHGRNMVCLKCESRRPGEVPLPVGQVKTPPIHNEKSSGYAPFVPLPADMFAKNPKNTTINNSKEAGTESAEMKLAVSINYTEKSVFKAESKVKDTAEEEKSERWFKKVAELHDVTDLASAISDDDFPDIMPMRKGESRFVVSKKKDRSLTSPTYKRQQAMEQGNDKSSFVPFVPFPPGYFAKKDDNQQSKSSHSHVNSSKATNDTSIVQDTSSKDTNDMNLVEETRIQLNRQSARPETSNGDGLKPENQNVRNTSSKDTNDMNFVEETRNQLSTQSARPETSNGDGLTPENQNIRNGFEGSSLEGSAVKETDPLDMSEEAKAERWFRRVAQIKDISELSQIPDEDFPSIMPMRKGVNRFVVSKRKTPLERRLTSPQYRKNLGTVNSEPAKKEGDGN